MAESFSESSPFDPSFMGRAGDTAAQLIQSSKDSAALQQKRLQDYINHLMQVRDMARLAARGAGARGASGMQNPLSVYKSLNQLSEQAGIPIDAEIQKAIQGSNNIENTMNDMISKAGSLYTQLAGIMQSRGGSSGGSSSIGGGSARSRSGQGPDQGEFIDIYGVHHKSNPGDVARNDWFTEQMKRQVNPEGGFAQNQPQTPVNPNEPFNPQLAINQDFNKSNPLDNQLGNFNFGQNPSFGNTASNNQEMQFNPNLGLGGGSQSNPFDQFLSGFTKNLSQLPGFDSIAPLDNYSNVNQSSEQAPSFGGGPVRQNVSDAELNNMFSNNQPSFGGGFEPSGTGQFPTNYNIFDLGF